ncbi:hypothetical protein PENTCL1PPCAC_4816, partial [Pristionchus entomophagus]
LSLFDEFPNMYAELSHFTKNEAEMLQCVAEKRLTRIRNHPRIERKHALYKHFWWKENCVEYRDMLRCMQNKT